MKTEEKKLKPPCSGFQFWQTHGRKDRVVKDFSWWLFSEVFVGVSVQVLQWSNSMSSFLNPMCSSSLGKFVAPSPPTMMYSSPSTRWNWKSMDLKSGRNWRKLPKTVSWCAFLDTRFTNSKWNSETVKLTASHLGSSSNRTGNDPPDNRKFTAPWDPGRGSTAAKAPMGAGGGFWKSAEKPSASKTPVFDIKRHAANVSKPFRLVKIGN